MSEKNGGGNVFTSQKTKQYRELKKTEPHTNTWVGYDKVVKHALDMQGPTERHFTLPNGCTVGKIDRRVTAAPNWCRVSSRMRLATRGREFESHVATFCYRTANISLITQGLSEACVRSQSAILQS